VKTPRSPFFGSEKTGPPAVDGSCLRIPPGPFFPPHRVAGDAPSSVPLWDRITPLSSLSFTLPCTISPELESRPREGPGKEKAP
jgi:hypothetical protein